MIKCPDCANCNEDKMVYSAKGTKIICLDCYMSWPTNMAPRRKYRPRARTPERESKTPPTYAQLWRENKAYRLKLEAVYAELRSAHRTLTELRAKGVILPKAPAFLNEATV